MKKCFALLALTIAVLCLMTGTTFAASGLKTDTISSDQIRVSGEPLSPERQQRMEQRLKEAANGRVHGLEPGETREVYRDKGGIMYVTVIDEG